MPLQLTNEQQAIVQHNTGPALVFAVAGSGKTTAMVHRIARLVQDGIFGPERILALAYNRAAVQQIHTHLQQWPQCRQVQVSTLHQLGLQIIRTAKDHAWVPARWKTHSSELATLQRQLLENARIQARKTWDSFREELDDLDADDFLDFVSICKNNLQYVALPVNLPDPTSSVEVAIAPKEKPWYLPLYRLYEEIRCNRAEITFDDQVVMGWELLSSVSELQALMQSKYQCVLVDEYQDVNRAQHALLDLLTQSHRNYMAIGDDDQTIYTWRGASQYFILQFQEYYGATKYVMEDNFRCRGNHIAIANMLIRQNQRREPKQMRPTHGYDGVTRLYRYESSLKMATGIAMEIASGIREQHRQYADYALLLRLNVQSPTIEQTLLDHEIPIHLDGRLAFFQRPEISPLRAYLQIGCFERHGALTADDAKLVAQAWLNCYQHPMRYLTRTFAKAVSDTIIQKQLCLSQSLQHMCRQPLADHLQAGAEQIMALCHWFADVVDSLPASEVLHRLDGTLGYCTYWEKKGTRKDPGEVKVESIKSFLYYVGKHGTVREVLHWLDTVDQQLQSTDTRDAVTITTIHKAKGLEFPVVIIPDCNDGIFPLGGDTADIEEERRLLYVAITRSQEELHLYSVKTRNDSPFLTDNLVREVLRGQTAFSRLLSEPPQQWTDRETEFLVHQANRHGLLDYVRLHWSDDRIPRITYHMVGYLDEQIMRLRSPELDSLHQQWSAVHREVAHQRKAHGFKVDTW